MSWASCCVNLDHLAPSSGEMVAHVIKRACPKLESGTCSTLVKGGRKGETGNDDAT